MIDEEVISRLLHDAAGRIPVPSQLDEVLADTVVVPVRVDAAPDRTRRLRRRAVVAACLLAVAAVTGLVVTRDDGPALYAGPPRPVPAGAPAPGTVAAFVASPPAWAGTPDQGWRWWAPRTGHWVRAAFGVVDGDTVRRPITVAAFDGRFSPFGSPDADEQVEIDGTTYRSLRYGSWQALLTLGQPSVMVTGVVTGPDDHHLASVAALARPGYDDNGGLTLRLDRAPAGYSLVVPPQTLATVAGRRPTLAFGSSLGIDEVGSDDVDPLLAASGAGADLHAVRVGGTTGWFFRTTSTQGPLAAISWSPRPGVVFELVTTDPDRSVEDLAALAANTEIMPVEEWQARLTS